MVCKEGDRKEMQECYRRLSAESSEFLRGRVVERYLTLMGGLLKFLSLGRVVDRLYIVGTGYGSKGCILKVYFFGISADPVVASAFLQVRKCF